MFSQLDFFPKSFPCLTLVLSCHKTFDSQTSQALGVGSIPIAEGDAAPCQRHQPDGGAAGNGGVG